MYRGTLEVSQPNQCVIWGAGQKGWQPEKVAGEKEGCSPLYPLRRLGSQQPAGWRTQRWQGSHGLVQSG